MQGTTAALELARRGCQVDLFDRGARPITRAGLQNEGKLHLGFVYGNDPSLRTAARLADGALQFLPLVRRWAGSAAAHVRISSPYLYAVPADSMLPPDAVHRHFRGVEQCVRWLMECRREAAHYPGIGPEPMFRVLTDAETTREFSPKAIAAAFATREIAVDPVSVAAALRSALAAQPRIRFVPQTDVKAVEERGGVYTVRTAFDTLRPALRYDHVVNALWDGRLAIDQGMGLAPDRNWLWRYKVGVRIALPDHGPAKESVTFVLGSYGDFVHYEGGAAYASWYPAGLIGRSSDLVPPPAWTESARVDAITLVADTFDSLCRLYPALDWIRRHATRLDPVGGVIFAWGKTDIDDPDSELHSRYDVGVLSSGGYHTVNTGKYTLAPALAIDVADRIAPDVVQPPQ